jgi:hypothetical protein
MFADADPRNRRVDLAKGPAIGMARFHIEGVDLRWATSHPKQNQPFSVGDWKLLVERMSPIAA